MSAANWCALADQEEYSRVARQTTPLHLAAEQLTHALGTDETRSTSSALAVAMESAKST
jgi:hypothetical protein